MNNQHNSVINSVAGSNQRASGLSSKSVYQFQSSNISQLTHMHEQVMSGFSSPKPSEMSSHQFGSSMLGLNGNSYQQSFSGSSLHSGLNLDTPNQQLDSRQNSQTSNSQYNQLHHRSNQASLQPHQQQQQNYQSNSLSQHHSQQHQPQSQKTVSQLMLQSHQYNLHQGAQTQQQQMLPQHSQQKVIPQRPQQLQQRQQTNMHLPSRNQHQQHKFEGIQQPRHILQNTDNAHNRPVAKDPSSSKYLTNQPKDTSESVLDSSDTSGIVSEEDSSVKENKQVAEETEDKQIITDNAGSASENKELANTKEKTPMTLIQELAKFNKIERKYTLLDEQGPAHKKTFFVKLQLGTEEYSSSGASIRKAQQTAAAIALKETKYKHPIQKPTWRARKNPDPENGKLTPTVELNGLAMKRGEAALYKAIEPQQPPYYYPPGMNNRALYNPRYYHFMRSSRGDPRYPRGYWPMRYHYPKVSKAFYVSLRVGHREFIGDGATRQAARNNAAVKALKVLKNLPEKEVTEEEEPQEEFIDDDADGLKSRVTSVHEIAFRRRMTVNFEVIRESGPPHMKTFITRCTVGELVTEGEGNSKKISKKIAAEMMFEKLKELGPLPPNAVKPRPKTQVYKKKNRIKAEIQQQKANPNYGVGVNPISRLIQIMCAQKKQEPVYTLLTERGISCRKEFIMQIVVEGKTCNGSGPNKKLAKRAAAEAMLELLGYNKPTPQPAKSSIKQPSTEGHQGNIGEKKVTFSENCDKNLTNDSKAASAGVSGHQQKVPGLLHLPSKNMVTSPAVGSSITSLSTVSPLNHKESLIDLSSILKPNWKPELQLRELCKAMDYPLDIHDFTKNQSNNSVEYISRIHVGPVDKQQNFLGTSNTKESARDLACMDALKVLVSHVKDVHPAGDGLTFIKKAVLSKSSPGIRGDVS